MKRFCVYGFEMFNFSDRARKIFVVLVSECVKVFDFCDKYQEKCFMWFFICGSKFLCEIFNITPVLLFSFTRYYQKPYCHIFRL